MMLVAIGKGRADPKVPSPLPGRISPQSTIKSSFPSLLKSPAAKGRAPRSHPGVGVVGPAAEPRIDCAGVRVAVPSDVPVVMFSTATDPEGSRGPRAATTADSPY